MSWAVVVLVALALAGALWRIWRRQLIRRGDVLDVDGRHVTVTAVNPWTSTITIAEMPDDVGAGDEWRRL